MFKRLYDNQINLRLLHIEDKIARGVEIALISGFDGSPPDDHYSFLYKRANTMEDKISTSVINSIGHEIVQDAKNEVVSELKKESFINGVVKRINNLQLSGG